AELRLRSQKRGQGANDRGGRVEGNANERSDAGGIAAGQGAAAAGDSALGIERGTDRGGLAVVYDSGIAVERTHGGGAAVFGNDGSRSARRVRQMGPAGRSGAGGGGTLGVRNGECGVRNEKSDECGMGNAERGMKKAMNANRLANSVRPRGIKWRRPQFHCSGGSGTTGVGDGGNIGSSGSTGATVSGLVFSKQRALVGAPPCGPGSDSYSGLLQQPAAADTSTRQTGHRSGTENFLNGFMDALPGTNLGRIAAAVNGGKPAMIA